MAYIDEDNIPEVCMCFDDEDSSVDFLVYHNGAASVIFASLSNLSYVEKKNIYYCSSGRYGVTIETYLKLENGKETVLAQGSCGADQSADDYVEGEEFYYWNGAECNEDEYKNAKESFINSYVGDAEWEWTEVFYDDCYPDILSAFDALFTDV